MPETCFNCIIWITVFDVYESNKTLIIFHKVIIAFMNPSLTMHITKGEKISAFIFTYFNHL
jgi:hypothetical protein